MKKISFMFLYLCIICAVYGQSVTIHKGLRSITVEKPDSVVFHPQKQVEYLDNTTGTLDGHDWVQLWENGPKWATMNVGAMFIEDYGDYFQWGAGSFVYEFTTQCYKVNKDIQGTSYDMATATWGDNWCLPTSQDLSDLLNSDNTIKTMTTQNGYFGLLVKGRGHYSSNSVFLPAAGNIVFGVKKDLGEDCFYWCSTSYSSVNAFHIWCYKTYINIYFNGKEYGQSVRAIVKE
ncbi:MAG: hypothetical protein J5900_04155 [Prevotella sp.]|nr:hypothetical protein [Prevotella sp.]MBQ8058725.1 hypothetical protein [Prevotella sp.]